MKVGDEFRTNPLSTKPGGDTVRVVFNTGNVREYDKVKYPEAFIEKCFEMDSTIINAAIILESGKKSFVFERAEWEKRRYEDFGGPNRSLGI